MDFLRAEIERKAAEAAAATSGKRKYFKRAELEDRREDVVLHSKSNKRRVSDTFDAAEDMDEEDELDESQLHASETEVTRRLRARGEPIRLFGEDNHERRLRLRRVEAEAPDVTDRQRNEMIEALANVNQDLDEELVQGEAREKKDKIKYTHGELLELANEMDFKKDSSKAQSTIRKIFKFFFHCWEHDLDERPSAAKRTTEGRTASATFKQTELYLKPMFRMLRKKECPADMMECMTEIALNVMRREYIQANDWYLKMAIGNAAWPIGVTNVGIHSRTGREKIFSQNIAHVLNDEKQRKYIQGMKRLMTYAQKRWVADPSKCLEYEGVKSELYPEVAPE